MFAQDKAATGGGSAAADFSIAISGALSAVRRVRGAQVGFDLEYGTDARLGNWVAREADGQGRRSGHARPDEVRLTDGGANCRGTSWYARPPEHFPGRHGLRDDQRPQVAAVQVRALPLADLFAA